MTVKSYVILVSNLDEVVFTHVGLHIHCNALIIESGEHPVHEGYMQHKIRGFLTSGSLPVFQTVIPSPKFERRRNGEVVESAELFSGSTLIFEEGGPSIRLIASTINDHSIPIMFETFDDPNYGLLWDQLEMRAAHFWDRTRIPVCKFESIVEVRRRIGSTSVLVSNEARANYETVNNAQRASVDAARSAASKGSRRDS